jgi:hypothetical protein
VFPQGVQPDLINLFPMKNHTRIVVFCSPHLGL